MMRCGGSINALDVDHHRCAIALLPPPSPYRLVQDLLCGIPHRYISGSVIGTRHHDPAACSCLGNNVGIYIKIYIFSVVIQQKTR